MMTYITENWVTLVAAYVAFEKFVRLVVSLTPTLKDDSIADKVFGFFSKLALISPDKK